MAAPASASSGVARSDSSCLAGRGGLRGGSLLGIPRTLSQIGRTSSARSTGLVGADGEGEEDPAEYCVGGYKVFCDALLYRRTAPGDRVGGRYTVHSKLGWGQYSTVWLARDGDGGGLVALKIAKADVAATSAREIEIMGACLEEEESSPWWRRRGRGRRRRGIKRGRALTARRRTAAAGVPGNCIMSCKRGARMHYNTCGA
eukprot:gene39850-biopygen104930